MDKRQTIRTMLGDWCYTYRKTERVEEDLNILFDPHTSARKKQLILSDGFRWSDTTQGHKFWREECVRLGQGEQLSDIAVAHLKDTAMMLGILPAEKVSLEDLI